MSDWPLIVFYDGTCPFCRDEMQRLKRWDTYARLVFVNIQAPDFDASNYGLQLIDLMRLLHVQSPAGQLFIGMPAVRLVYHAVGKGWLFWPSRLPLLRPVFDTLYARFAARRLLWSRLLLRKPCTDGSCNLS
jgi:predicted DCC family thiol-disulfide oxidoreductase YuxK